MKAERSGGGSVQGGSLEQPGLLVIIGIALAKPTEDHFL